MAAGRGVGCAATQVGSALVRSGPGMQQSRSRHIWLKAVIMLSGDSGSTLVGELVAVAILGLALVVLLSAISTGMMGMAIVEKRVAGENLARRQLEEIKAADYQANPTVQPYPAIPVDGPYSVTVTVTHWVSPTGPFATAMQSPDSGLQCIAVTVSHDGEPAARLEGFKVRR